MLFRFSLVAAFAALLAATGASAQTPPLRKITVGLLFISADAGMFVAQEKGYFAEQGLEVEFNRFTSGAAQIPLLATDQLAVGSGGATPGLFNAYVRSVHVPIVASKAMIAPDVVGGNVFMARTDLYESGQVRGARDLKGLRIVVNNIQSPSINYVARAMAVGGLTKDDATVLEMPFEQFIPALQKKAVDVVLPFSPLGETIANRLKVGVPLPDTAIGKTSGYDTANMMFYSPRVVKDPALARGFMIAHLKAQRDYHRALFEGGGDRGEICAMIKKYLPFVPDRCEGMAMSAVEPDGAINIESLERYQADWVKWGMMREPADIRADVNTTYVEAAVAVLGRYRK